MTPDTETLIDYRPDAAPDARFVRETGMAARIAGIAEPRLEALGFRLVKVTVSGRNGTTVQIMAERPADGRLTVGECEQISRDLSPALDVDDALPGHYHLEVSSPGIDRPLVRPSDFASWAGYEARIEFSQLVDGRRRVRGKLEGFENNEVRIEIEGVPGAEGPVVLGLSPALIANARLVLTEDLIREDLRRSSRDKDNADPESDGTEETTETDHGHGRRKS